MLMFVGKQIKAELFVQTAHAISSASVALGEGMSQPSSLSVLEPLAEKELFSSLVAMDVED